jgi:BirA family biotin operon repressor/biotin-[acetyl-CoA-carboxylase] ligase
VRDLTGQSARVKWPNDVLVHGKKVCGILIEQSQATVAGIGLNVQQSAAAFAEAGLPDAGSLALFTNDALDTDRAARVLITHLDAEYDRLCRGDLATLEAAWQTHSGLLGRPVVVECHDRELSGHLRDMTWDAIVLESAEGVVSLRPESIRHLREVL